MQLIGAGRARGKACMRSLACRFLFFCRALQADLKKTQGTHASALQSALEEQASRLTAEFNQTVVRRDHTIVRRIRKEYLVLSGLGVVLKELFFGGGHLNGPCFFPHERRI